MLNALTHYSLHNAPTHWKNGGKPYLFIKSTLHQTRMYHISIQIVLQAEESRTTAWQKSGRYLHYQGVSSHWGKILPSVDRWMLRHTGCSGYLDNSVQRNKNYRRNSQKTLKQMRMYACVYVFWPYDCSVLNLSCLRSINRRGHFC